MEETSKCLHIIEVQLHTFAAVCMQTAVRSSSFDGGYVPIVEMLQFSS